MQNGNARSAGVSNRVHVPAIMTLPPPADLTAQLTGDGVIDVYKRQRYGMVRTDHILFVAAGAFHVSKPSDLIPELQGRFPIRVELQSLTMEDFVRILTEPKSSLTRQYIALLETEGVKLEFTPEALVEVARFAFRVNEGTENIGARRLHTIMELSLIHI